MILCPGLGCVVFGSYDTTSISNFNITEMLAEEVRQQHTNVTSLIRKIARGMVTKAVNKTYGSSVSLLFVSQFEPPM